MSHRLTHVVGDVLFNLSHKAQIVEGRKAKSCGPGHQRFNFSRELAGESGDPPWLSPFFPVNSGHELVKQAKSKIQAAKLKTVLVLILVPPFTRLRDCGAVT